MNHQTLIADFQAGGFHDVREVVEAAAEIPTVYYPHDRVYIILEGAMHVHYNGTLHMATTGAYLFLPAGKFHQRIIPAEGCRYLIAQRVW